MTASTRFLGGSPLTVAFRLILLSILVGVVLAAIGFDPWNILNSIRLLFQRLWDLGFDAINWLWRYFLLGAVIVIPVWLLIADVRRAARAIDPQRRRRLLAPPSRVTTAQVFAIAGPAMVANLTTPLIGIVSTIAIGRLGDATLLGGVAIASVIFDCLFWLFAFLRMSTVAFTAQALGAGETQEMRAQLVRGLAVAALIGACLIRPAGTARRPSCSKRWAAARASPAPRRSTSRSESGRRRWRSPITSCSAG